MSRGSVGRWGSDWDHLVFSLQQGLGCITYLVPLLFGHAGQELHHLLGTHARTQTPGASQQSLHTTLRQTTCHQPTPPSGNDFLLLVKNPQCRHTGGEAWCWGGACPGWRVLHGLIHHGDKLILILMDYLQEFRACLA